MANFKQKEWLEVRLRLPLPLINKIDELIKDRFVRRNGWIIQVLADRLREGK